MLPAPSIHISNASLTYHHIKLFDQLNLTLPAEKWTCLLGPSGVGKTSLLRLIAGLASGIDKNTMVSTSDGNPLSGRLAYMAQQDLLLPWLSVLDNVLIGQSLRQQKDEKIIEKAEYLLIKVGLKEHLQKKPHQLSGGQRQRVALVRTLIEDRPVVLMDEPFASVDAITRLGLQEIAAEFLAKRTVLLVTHDPLEALRLGDTIYVMSGLPATLTQVPHPATKPPRRTDSVELLELQAKLLQQLKQAQESSIW